MPADTTIVRAAIHPAIGIARVGNSREPDGYFIGPEVSRQPALDLGKYKDHTGALKRQAAQFRVYGFNAAGEVVAELTAADARIEWTVGLANKKAAWYEFQMALDVPEASAANVSRLRNRTVTGDDRKQLVISPSPRSITGPDQSGPEFRFDDGKFYHLDVSLGELRTDAQGRLLVLGGLGVSRSHTGEAPTTFANNNDWHDDISDGPVDARVTIDGHEIPVAGAWVAVAPPNYAPVLKTARTMYDLLEDRMVAWGLLPAPGRVSFFRHILPIFERLSGMQWVNAGFASSFGVGSPHDVDVIRTRLADASAANRPFRTQILEQFRNPGSAPPRLGKLLWPSFYGDALDGLATAPGPDPSLSILNGLASLSQLQLRRLQAWADGDFDAAPPSPPPQSIDDVPLADRPAALDEAALDYCLADAFHPGCELTWPMRIRHLYDGPFRIKRRPAAAPEPDFGPTLTPDEAVSPTGPLNGAAAGDLTKWMAVPWQTDTASCLSGYDFFMTASSLPTFWPARVPNDVLREVDYRDVMNPGLSQAARLAAFRNRPKWFRGFTGEEAADNAQMVTDFHKLGIIEEREGPHDLPGVPSRLWVESVPDLPEPTDGGGVLGAAAGAPAALAGFKLRQPGHYGQTPA
jgi:hypothetical protein